MENRLFYVVEKGDALWKIAAMFKVDIKELYKLNLGTIGNNPDLIHPNQFFVLPENATMPEGYLNPIEAIPGGFTLDGAAGLPAGTLAAQAAEAAVAETSEGGGAAPAEGGDGGSGHHHHPTDDEKDITESYVGQYDSDVSGPVADTGYTGRASPHVQPSEQGDITATLSPSSDPDPTAPSSSTSTTSPINMMSLNAEANQQASRSKGMEAYLSGERGAIMSTNSAGFPNIQGGESTPAPEPHLSPRQQLDSVVGDIKGWHGEQKEKFDGLVGTVNSSSGSAARSAGGRTPTNEELGLNGMPVSSGSETMTDRVLAMNTANNDQSSSKWDQLQAMKPAIGPDHNPTGRALTPEESGHNDMPKGGLASTQIFPGATAAMNQLAQDSAKDAMQSGMSSALDSQHGGGPSNSVYIGDGGSFTLANNDKGKGGDGPSFVDKAAVSSAAISADQEQARQEFFQPVADAMNDNSSGGPSKMDRLQAMGTAIGPDHNPTGRALTPEELGQNDMPKSSVASAATKNLSFENRGLSATQLADSGLNRSRDSKHNPSTPVGGPTNQSQASSPLPGPSSPDFSKPLTKGGDGGKGGGFTKGGDGGKGGGPTDGTTGNALISHIADARKSSSSPSPARPISTSGHPAASVAHAATSGYGQMSAGTTSSASKRAAKKKSSKRAHKGFHLEPR